MTNFGQPHRHYAECGSTNDLARAWACDADNPASHGALVTADFQTQGRGRRGNRWDAPKAQSALMSFVLRPNIGPEGVWQLGFLTALAAADALQHLDLPARLKWPNDILLNSCKVGGVLVEAVLPRAPHTAMIAIAGIGLNVNQARFPADNYAYPPASLRRESGREWDIAQVVDAVAASFGSWDAAYQQGAFAPIFAAWQDRLAVGATLKRGTETAALTELLPNGHARVRFEDGTFAEWLALD